MLSKFPAEVIVKLEESKNLDENWTVKLLRESLASYINIHENAQRHEYNSKSSFNRGQRRNDNYSQRRNDNYGQRRNENYSTEKQSNQFVDTLMVDSTKNIGKQGNQQRRREPSFPCIFCKGAHFNDNCDKFITAVDRKHQLTTQGRCFICLKIGHLFKECPNAYSKLCCYCRKTGHHNRSIFPKQFTISSETTAVNQSSVGDSEKCQPEITTETITDTVAPAVNTDHMLLTSGERVLLQTAVVPVYCTNGSIISARVLLDSASQRTFMTRRLAEQLKLPCQRKENLSISTFGSQGPQNIDTYVVHFTIITKDNSNMNLHANVLNQITSPIQRGPLQQLDLEFLKSISPEKFADVVPGSAKTATIDILFGSDYFWNIVDVGRIILPSGLLLLSSKLGYLLTGKFMDPNDDVKLNKKQLLTCFVMTQMNQSVPELNLFSTVDSVTHRSPNLSDLWSLDAIGISDSPYLSDDDKALDQFNKTIYYDGE